MTSVIIRAWILMVGIAVKKLLTAHFAPTAFATRIVQGILMQQNSASNLMQTIPMMHAIQAGFLMAIVMMAAMFLNWILMEVIVVRKVTCSWLVMTASAIKIVQYILTQKQK